ncbi:MAG: hypothetical protein ACI4TJ_02950 [Candidatus Cryptobacteroides sp.]
MIENKAIYIAPKVEVIVISGSKAVLQGSDSPSYGYDDNDLGELA